MTGELLPAPFAHVAAAQAAGEISERHARIIVDTVDKLPEDVQAEHGEQIETELVELARQFDPRQLGTLAARIGYCYDQDGAAGGGRAARQAPRVSTSTSARTGRCPVQFEGTAEFGEFLPLTFDALGRPHARGRRASKTPAPPGSAATTRCSRR